MQILNPDGIWHSEHYVCGMRVGNTIYTAGRVPVDTEGNVVAPNNAMAQTEHIMEDLGRILAEGGATLADVVYVRTYYLNQKDMPVIFQVLHRYLEHRPPHTGSKMDSPRWEQNGTRLEIEVIAALEA